MQEIKLHNKKRYMLLDDAGLPVIPVIKYLKYLDSVEKSPNTQKTYCYALKLYFEYLDEIDMNYKKITFETLAKFVGWLRNPFNLNTIPITKQYKATRTARTIVLYKY